MIRRIDTLSDTTDRVTGLVWKEKDGLGLVLFVETAAQKHL